MQITIASSNIGTASLVLFLQRLPTQFAKLIMISIYFHANFVSKRPKSEHAW